MTYLDSGRRPSWGVFRCMGVLEPLGAAGAPSAPGVCSLSTQKRCLRWSSAGGDPQSVVEFAAHFQLEEVNRVPSTKLRFEIAGLPHMEQVAGEEGQEQDRRHCSDVVVIYMVRVPGRHQLVEAMVLDVPPAVAQLDPPLHGHVCAPETGRPYPGGLLGLGLPEPRMHHGARPVCRMGRCYAHIQACLNPHGKGPESITNPSENRTPSRGQGEKCTCPSYQMSPH